MHGQRPETEHHWLTKEFWEEDNFSPLVRRRVWNAAIVCAVCGVIFLFQLIYMWLV